MHVDVRPRTPDSESLGARWSCTMLLNRAEQPTNSVVFSTMHLYASTSEMRVPNSASGTSSRRSFAPGQSASIMFLRVLHSWNSPQCYPRWPKLRLYWSPCGDPPNPPKFLVFPNPRVGPRWPELTDLWECLEEWVVGKKATIDIQLALTSK